MCIVIVLAMINSINTISNLGGKLIVNIVNNIQYMDIIDIRHHYQGGDTRREEVLSKVLVDISIHTTSHASDTAQN